MKRLIAALAIIGSLGASAEDLVTTTFQNAESGDRHSQFTLGQWFEDGLFGLTQDYKQAFRWYLLAANQGEAEAQLSLGDLYYSGTGVPENRRTASWWYRRAAQQGHSQAQLNLGRAYAYAIGVPADQKEAFKWFQLAAEQGERAAQFNVGYSLDRGQGVPEDNIAGYAWYNISAANGDPNASFLKNEIIKELTPQGIEKAQALSREMVEENPKLMGD